MKNSPLAGLVDTLHQVELQVMRASETDLAESEKELCQAIDKLYGTFRARCEGFGGSEEESQLREMIRMQRAVEMLRTAASPRRAHASEGSFRFSDLVEVVESAFQEIAPSSAGLTH